MKPFPYNSVLEEVESTNDYARKMAEEGAPHGSWISAKSQTSGRGRLGREWKSNVGNLFLSVVLRPERDYPMTWVPLAVALAVYQAAKDLKPELDLVLKWPNDLGIRDRKLGFRKIGGILCEGVGSASGTYVIAGIGVNCAIAPETDQPTAALGVSVDSFRENLVPRLAGITRGSFQDTRADYTRASLLRRGDAIEWKDLRLEQESPLHPNENTGVFEAYGDNGELLARPDGKLEVQRLFSEEIKLRVGKT
jgi:BirA family biotin operon repressor/biotin-[acetyl-CoA-carboxylase] ligase